MTDSGRVATATNAALRALFALERDARADEEALRAEAARAGTLDDEGLEALHAIAMAYLDQVAELRAQLLALRDAHATDSDADDDIVVLDDEAPAGTAEAADARLVEHARTAVEALRRLREELTRERAGASVQALAAIDRFIAQSRAN